MLTVGGTVTLPKNRTTVYTVVRHETDVSISGDHCPSVALAVYYSHERAHEIAAKYDQEFIDRGINKFYFEVHATTYYDE